jgi:hypothetical protein
MRKTRLFLLAGLFLATGLYLAGAPRAAAQCPCHFVHNTPNFVGTGSSCVLADGSVFDQADAYANDGNCTVGVCDESAVIVTIACSFNSSTGQYQETGHIRFGCLTC